MAMHVDEPSNPVPKDYAERENAVSYTVRDGDNWQSVAKLWTMTARELIFWNFKTTNAREVNWYLREYVGCTKSRDGKNYSFSARDNPGKVWFPRNKVILPVPDTSRVDKIFLLADNHFHKGFSRLKAGRGGLWVQVHTVGPENGFAGKDRSNSPVILFTVSDEHAVNVCRQLLTESTVSDTMVFDYERNGTVYHWLRLRSGHLVKTSLQSHPETGSRLFEFGAAFDKADWKTQEKPNF